MAKRSNHLDWSQKLFVACFCLGLLVLGMGGAVKASRLMGGPAADPPADAPVASSATEPPAEVASSPEPAPEADEEKPKPTPAPTATPEVDADHAAEMAKADKPGAHGDEKDPAKEGAKGDGAGGDALPESQRRSVYAAIVRARSEGDEAKADATIAAFSSANGLSKAQVDDIAEEGKMKGWSDGGEAKGDVDADKDD